MDYIIKKWHEGEVKDVDGAKGWIMPDGEFRPLMSDAMETLYKAGLVDMETVQITAEERGIYTQRTLEEYRIAQQNRTPEQIAEERYEARAAHGPGVKLVNILTGETYTT